MRITKQVIKGLLPFIPKRDPRAVLKGALIGRTKSGEPYAIATDGRIGVKLQWEEKFPVEDFPESLCEVEVTRRPGNRIVNTEDLNRIEKMIPRVKHTPILNGAVLGEEVRKDHAVPVVATDLSTISKSDITPVEGTYPDFDRVIPKPVLDEDNPTYTAVGISVENMIRALQGLMAAGAYESSKHYAVSLYVPKDPRAPILLRGYGYDSGLDATVVVMPVVNPRENEPKLPEILLNRRGFDPMPEPDSSADTDTPDTDTPDSPGDSDSAQDQPDTE